MSTLFQARTERDLKRPGYCVTSHLRTTLSYVASGRFHKEEEIVAKKLGDEIPRSEKYLVIAAMRHLGFIDEQNRITDTLEQLVHAIGEEYEAKLRKVLEEAYVDFYHIGLDLVHATPQDFRQAFQACNYEPSDMQLKMIALYKGLARMAGILPDESKESQEGNRQITSTPSSPPSLNTVSLASVEDTHMNGVPQTSQNGHTSLDVPDQELFLIQAQSDHLQRLLKQLSLEAGQSKQKPGGWVRTLRGNFDVLLQLLIEKEPEV